MAKQTGIVSNLYVDEVDASGDVGAIDSINTSRVQLDVTAINADFMERLPGLGDGEISFSGFFNRAATHPELSAMSTAVKAVTATLGVLAGQAAASMTSAEASYNTTRGSDGSLTFQSQFLSGGGYGVEWGVLLTNGKQTAAGSGTATATVDNTTSSANGGAAYLHAFSIGSGTATILVEHSTDNSSFSSVTGGTFTEFSAATAQRITLTGTINRYTRFNATGTFGTAVFAVTLKRT